MVCGGNAHWLATGQASTPFLPNHLPSIPSVSLPLLPGNGQACGGVDSLFKGVQGHLTRNNGMEFSKGQFMLNYKRNLLTARSIRLENRLPREVSAIARVI